MAVRGSREGLVCSVLLWLSLAALAVPAHASVGPARLAAAEAAARKAERGVEGIATYYAKRFNGRKTTSGEVYRPEEMTAAHPHLPLGTKVKVVDPESDREVVVTVNDRCRKRGVPIIDLSRGAARALGFLGKGLIRVRIVTLGGATASRSMAAAD